MADAQRRSEGSLRLASEVVEREKERLIHFIIQNLLKQQIKEDQGINPSNFLNPNILRSNVHLRILEQEAPALELVMAVKEKVQLVTNLIIDEVFRNFKELQEQMKDAAKKVLEDIELETIAEVKKMLKIEATFTYQRTGLYERLLRMIEAEEIKWVQLHQGQQVADDAEQTSYLASAASYVVSRMKKTVDDVLRNELSETSFLKKQANFYKKNEIDTRSQVQLTSIEEQNRIMLKSIYAYWTVFTFRFTDNLHQRVKFNLLFDFKDNVKSTICTKFMPSTNEQVSEWMDEPVALAAKRHDLTTALEKISKCLDIVSSMDKKNY